MTASLPIDRVAVNAATMRGRFISLFVLFAVLFGSVVMPAIAHAEAPITSQGSEASAHIEHAEESGDVDHHGQSGEVPCHVVAHHHHHCGAALGAESPALDAQASLRAAKLLPLTVSAMASLSQAPPTEPPAA